MAISPEHQKDPEQENQSKSFHEGLYKKIQLLETAKEMVADAFVTHPNISNDFLKKNERNYCTHVIDTIDEYIFQIKNNRLY